MQSYDDYMERVMAIHHETVRRLVDRDGTNLPEIAEMFEDIANLYLDISEEIRVHLISEEVGRLFPVLPSIASLSSTEHLGAEIAG